MAATTTEPVKVRKPPKLFSVTGDETGIHVVLSNGCLDELNKALAFLRVLSKAPQLPKAGAVADALHEFLSDPTAKVEAKA